MTGETSIEHPAPHHVTDEELPALKGWLEAYLPDSWKIYCQVREKMCGRWTGVTFYTLSWPDIRAVAEGLPDDTCVIPEFYTTPRWTCVYSPCAEDARTLITYPGFIDWSKPVVFMCMASGLTEMVEAVSKETGDDNPDVECLYLLTADSDKDIIKGSLCLEEFNVRNLDFEKDGEFAVKNWPISPVFPKSSDYIRALSKAYNSVGVFDKDDSCVGYALSYECGLFGFTYVKPEYRRRGLGTFITEKMAEYKFAEGASAAVMIDSQNTRSIKLHEKLGFKFRCKVAVVIHNNKGLMALPKY